MSAAEKLKALEWGGYPGRKNVIVAALPQIRAVVEAADKLPEFFHTPDGQIHSFVPLLDVLDEALP